MVHYYGKYSCFVSVQFLSLQLAGALIIAVIFYIAATLIESQLAPWLFTFVLILVWHIIVVLEASNFLS